ncbi:hypothetical protein BJ508DRAFT_334944 [Ascobolus immersus RN42]|uniref:Uncharacterized protein n=1 Tax=Ascobolus immersus RN42 TaxID=1160509 RepID=A0A3N4HK82_ASCIM|nr:hypothetical protein BJ508DRAFT_334944 [Ascobolus immersus RN42]
MATTETPVLDSQDDQPLPAPQGAPNPQTISTPSPSPTPPAPVIDSDEITPTLADLEAQDITVTPDTQAQPEKKQQICTRATCTASKKWVYLFLVGLLLVFIQVAAIMAIVLSDKAKRTGEKQTVHMGKVVLMSVYPSKGNAKKD